MPPDQLVGELIGDRGQVPGLALFQQQRQKDDLEEDVAQFVAHRGVVPAPGGFGQLVCLLDRVRHDRALILLTVPGALGPEPPRHLVQAPERLVEGSGFCHA